jgi:hypothetical protein
LRWQKIAKAKTVSLLQCFSDLQHISEIRPMALHKPDLLDRRRPDWLNEDAHQPLVAPS